MKKYDFITKKFLKKMYPENFSYQIRKLGLGCFLISKELKRYKIIWTKGKDKHNFVSKEFLIQEYNRSKKSKTQIAKELGCSEGTIRKKFIEFNIPSRSRSKILKGLKKKPPTKRHRENLAKAMRGRKRKPFTRKTRKKMSLAHGGTGKPHENSKYPKEFYRIRRKILKRDNHICQKCFKYGNHAHHINYNKQDNNEYNLITLCNKCNCEVNKSRYYWKKYFRKRNRLNLWRQENGL